MGVRATFASVYLKDYSELTVRDFMQSGRGAFFLAMERASSHTGLAEYELRVPDDSIRVRDVIAKLDVVPRAYVHWALYSRSYKECNT